MGTATFDLEGNLGGYDTQGDNAVLSIIFRDVSDVALSSTSIGPVTTADRGSRTGLLFRNASGSVPIGTRNVLVNLQMTRLHGSYNDGYADSLSLELQWFRCRARTRISRHLGAASV